MTSPSLFLTLWQPQRMNVHRAAIFSSEMDWRWMDVQINYLLWVADFYSEIRRNERRERGGNASACRIFVKSEPFLLSTFLARFLLCFTYPFTYFFRWREREGETYVGISLLEEEISGGDEENERRLFTFTFTKVLL